MNHSLKSYLKRQSTEVLQAVLVNYLQRLTKDGVPNEMLLIQKILENRNKPTTTENTLDISACRQSVPENDCPDDSDGEYT